MVGVHATEQVRLDAEPAAHGQGHEELADHLHLEAVAQDDGRQVRVELAPGPAGQVDDHPGQGLVQGHVGVGEAGQTGVVAQGLLEGITQTEAHVLHQVVAVHGQVARGLDLQAEAAVLGDLHQHVVEVAQARADADLAAIQVQAQLDAGLAGDAIEGGGPHGSSWSR